MSKVESTVELGAKSAQSDIEMQEDENIISLPKAPLNVSVMLATLFSVMHSLNLGLAICVPNNSQPVMMEIFKVDDFMWSLIVSLYALGGAFGGAAGGPAAGALGYKKAMLYDNLVWIVAGALQAFAAPGSVAGPYMLIAGRLLCGFAAGFACAAVGPYIVDIAPDAYRGYIGMMHQLFVVLGVLISTVLGMQAIMGNVSLWAPLWGIYILPAVIGFGLIFYPESPRVLFNNGDSEAAAASLRVFRGPSYDIEPELAQYGIDKQKQDEEAAGQLDFISGLKQLFGAAYGKQMIICLMLHVGMQFCGINAINYYSGQIFRDAGMDGEMASLYLQLANMVATFASVALVEKAGRKALMVGGFGAMGVCLAVCCVFLTMAWNVPSIIAIVCGVMAFAVGPGGIPWVVCNELLPSSVRPAGMTLMVPLNWGLAYVVGQVYPFMALGLGTYSLLPFGVFSIAFTFYVLLFVPETKGKSMAEIEAMFKKSN